MQATSKCVAEWILRLAALLPAALVLAGCAHAPVQIEYETDGHLDTSTGGRLYHVRATEVGALHLKPGVRFADYATVAFRPATLAYRGAPRMPTPFDRKAGNYRLRTDASGRLQRELGAALTRGLARAENVRVVSEPTSDTLMISPHIVRLRWETPPAQGGESLFVRRTGLMTLVLQLRDAETGALLAQLADARLIRPADVGLSGAYESTPANNWAAVRDVYAHWGWTLRGTLETLRALPPMPTP